MSESILRRIKQLEHQNAKFKKLLESTLQITKEDAAKCLELRSEINSLKNAVSELEEQKRQLEEELKQYQRQDSSQTKETEPVDVQKKLDDALSDVERKSSELNELQIEDINLKVLLAELESEKQALLKNMNLIKEFSFLAEENEILKEELAGLGVPLNASASSSQSGEDLVTKMLSIENRKHALQEEIDKASKTSDPLGVSVENTVLEIKMAGLERQKQNALKDLQAKLLQSASEIYALHKDTTDIQLRGLLNELDLHKTILMIHLSDVKDVYHIKDKEKCDLKGCGPKPTKIVNDLIEENLLTSVNHQINIRQFLMSSDHETSTDAKPSSSSFSNTSDEILQSVRESSGHFVQEDLNHNEQNYLPTVSEEDEGQNDFQSRHEELTKEIVRLEQEREQLEQQMMGMEERCYSSYEKQSGEPTDDIPRLPLDGAIKQMYAEDQRNNQNIKHALECVGGKIKNVI